MNILDYDDWCEQTGYELFQEVDYSYSKTNIHTHLQEAYESYVADMTDKIHKDIKADRC